MSAPESLTGRSDVLASERLVTLMGFSSLSFVMKARTQIEEDSVVGGEDRAGWHAAGDACERVVLHGAGIDDSSDTAVQPALWFGSGAFRQLGPLGCIPLPFMPGVTFASVKSHTFSRPSPAIFARGQGPVVASDFGGGDSTTTAKKKNPPPKTKPGKVAVTIQKLPGIQCDISVEVLEDKVDKDAKSEGETTCWWKDRQLDPPVPVFDTSNGLAMVSSVTKAAKASGVLAIQTAYKKKNAEYMISGYGRGTTADDIKAGDVTLGFHESCHRNDFIHYLNTQKLPDFEGTPGMVAQDYNDDWKAFMDAFLDLPRVIGDWSKPLTDDVGFPEAKWDAKHKKK